MLADEGTSNFWKNASKIGDFFIQWIVNETKKDCFGGKRQKNQNLWCFYETLFEIAALPYQSFRNKGVFEIIDDKDIFMFM